ncbi:TlpA family protein disulfide reductase [Tenacibaculum sediminilitoris]|uniref:TlpA family protein disulfide reductase n=1 Tax=Tenacibaculum sediminilitoris TaxID=1820334 RepID=UPI0038B53FDA
MDKMEAIEKKNEERKKALDLNSKAPILELLDENGSLVTLESLSNSNALLVFSEIDCPYCINSITKVNEIVKNNPDLKVYYINYNSEPEKNKVYKNKHKLKASVLSGTDMTFERYKIQSTPTFILLSKDNIILQIGGEIDNIDFSLLSKKL